MSVDYSLSILGEQQLVKRVTRFLHVSLENVSFQKISIPSHPTSFTKCILNWSPDPCRIPSLTSQTPLSLRIAHYTPQGKCGYFLAGCKFTLRKGSPPNKTLRSTTCTHLWIKQSVTLTTNKHIIWTNKI